MDVLGILNSTSETLKAEAMFVPLKVRELLSNCTEDAKETFMKDVKNAYMTCLEYLDKWLQPLDECEIFDWMVLKDADFCFKKVVSSLQFLNGYGVCLNDVMLFDKITAINSFVRKLSNDFLK